LLVCDINGAESLDSAITVLVKIEMGLFHVLSSKKLLFFITPLEVTWSLCQRRCPVLSI